MCFTSQCAYHQFYHPTGAHLRECVHPTVSDANFCIMGCQISSRKGRIPPAHASVSVQVGCCQLFCTRNEITSAELNSLAFATHIFLYIGLRTCSVWVSHLAARGVLVVYFGSDLNSVPEFMKCVRVGVKVGVLSSPEVQAILCRPLFWCL